MYIVDAQPGGTWRDKLSPHGAAALTKPLTEFTLACNLDPKRRDVQQADHVRTIQCIHPLKLREISLSVARCWRPVGFFRKRAA